MYSLCTYMSKRLPLSNIDGITKIQNLINVIYRCIEDGHSKMAEIWMKKLEEMIDYWLVSHG